MHVCLHLPKKKSRRVHIKPLALATAKLKWALRCTAINKASGCDGIPAELFRSLKDDAIKVLCSLCQQIWKTQQ